MPFYVTFRLRSHHEWSCRGRLPRCGPQVFCSQSKIYYPSCILHLALSTQPVFNSFIYILRCRGTSLWLTQTSHWKKETSTFQRLIFMDLPSRLWISFTILPSPFWILVVELDTFHALRLKFSDRTLWITVRNCMQLCHAFLIETMISSSLFGGIIFFLASNRCWAQ